ncbi:MAG: hypothetical protein ACTSX8_03235 [Alphaproteobacteria bacterium]
MTFKQRWYRFWLQAAYALHLRWPATLVQRWIKGELNAPKAKLKIFDTPQGVVDYAQSRFHYRADTGRVGGLVFPLDWVTHPEVFQARLDDKTVADGDCDDYHYWAANVLSLIEGVDRVYLLSSGYPGGAHATVVLRYRGRWMLLDYRLHDIADPNVAPIKVAKIHAHGSTEVPWYVFESVWNPWRAAAIGPDRIEA